MRLPVIGGDGLREAHLVSPLPGRLREVLVPGHLSAPDRSGTRPGVASFVGTLTSRVGDQVLELGTVIPRLGSAVPDTTRPDSVSGVRRGAPTGQATRATPVGLAPRGSTRWFRDPAGVRA